MSKTIGMCRAREPSRNTLQKTLLAIRKEGDVVSRSNGDRKIVFHDRMQVPKKPFPVVVILNTNDGKSDGK